MAVCEVAVSHPVIFWGQFCVNLAAKAKPFPIYGQVVYRCLMLFRDKLHRKIGVSVYRVAEGCREMLNYLRFSTKVERS